VRAHAVLPFALRSEMDGSSVKISIEHASTGRATCKQKSCDTKIEKVRPAASGGQAGHGGRKERPVTEVSLLPLLRENAGQTRRLSAL
jgi:hypothetical protein